MAISTEIVHTLKKSIPFRLAVGVTGHRKLPDEKAAALAVRSVLEQIREKLPAEPNTQVYFTILSPLAEGADRLVAREVLKLEGSQLETVLPFDKDEYVKDFPHTKAEFESLLQQSKRVKQLGGKSAREHIYTPVGRHVVDHCDVLVALWNGQPAGGEGGTAEIVQYARDMKCPLFWINTQDPAQPVVFENGENLPVKIVEDLNKYNSEQIDEAKIRESVESEFKLFSEVQNDESGTKKILEGYATELREVYEKVLPHYVRADLLAGKYQRKYYLAGILIYSLAAAAVAVAAIQILESIWWGIPIAEVLLMMCVLFIIRRENRHKWHHKYIYYRSLAERFRTELFMSFGNVEVGGLSAPRRRSHSSPGDWITAAFTSIWSELPQFHQPDEAEFDALKKFLSRTWIQGQINYHDKKHKEHRKKNHLLMKIGTALFVLTLLAAFLHLLGNYGHKDHAAPTPAGKVATHVETAAASSHVAASESQAGDAHEPGVLAPMFDALHKIGIWLILIAVVAPAVGSALGAIRTHREYHRIATRHEETSRQLKTLNERIMNAENFMALLPLMRETEETMLRENEDWRAVVESREIEIP
ncbi:MAG TPA: hypothetical protein VGO96_04725 [Pyrinomonadaceae bacterium]|jgi:hypothetical protein|nr:hypothetical protein [Pyrinomonadaceae bacterium]